MHGTKSLKIKIIIVKLIIKKIWKENTNTERGGDKNTVINP